MEMLLPEDYINLALIFLLVSKSTLAKQKENSSVLSEVLDNWIA